MPFPLLAVAIPVLHSSGAWIASTAASGYIAATLSSTWIGAFVLGNSGLLASLGLVSAAGVYGALGGLTALASSTALGIGSALTAIGLGGMATSLGIAPVATFLGLTPVGWIIAGTTTALAAGIGWYFTRKTMVQINEERAKGGLGPITLAQIVAEVRLLEFQSLETILTKLSNECESVSVPRNGEVAINGQAFSISRLLYVINQDGSEEIVFKTKTGRKKRILIVRSAASAVPKPA
ncbi:MAG: hypothetical protein U1E06_05475 [Tabrizicola sp.]|uniref:hypothetical protein n=1 Tax=Tabrizicola sp. TaxID=2005166 RepID=UPI002735364A|nr:hypothetical protein [Tabrizicola sp.]MDP3263562.1 hypothetical protein [Tabrizicola sp.]MDP3649753.1 hypothetical protein [Paracoccaceae bacterium]MDZ4066289.1 hypothetical protein [Tabrizicola sp.]